MDMTKIPGMVRTLEFLTDHPERHDQGTWIDTDMVPDSHRNEELGIVKINPEKWDCGTAGCFAGWHSILNGWAPTLRDSENQSMMVKLDKQGRIIDAEAPAIFTEKDLGLTYAESRVFFSSENSIHDLWLIAETITNGQITVPDSVPANPDPDDSDESEWLADAKYDRFSDIKEVKNQMKYIDRVHEETLALREQVRPGRRTI